MGHGELPVGTARMERCEGQRRMKRFPQETGPGAPSALRACVSLDLRWWLHLASLLCAGFTLLGITQGMEMGGSMST